MYVSTISSAAIMAQGHGKEKEDIMALWRIFYYLYAAAAKKI